MRLSGRIRERLAAAQPGWGLMTLYEKFEHVVVLVLTGLIAAIITVAMWKLALKVLASILAPDTFDPSDYTGFQAILGMMFSVIIGLEFKRSLLVIAKRKEGIVQVRTVVLIALLAVVRKLLILDLATTEPLHLFAVAAAILALGGVYWFVRDQDRRDRIDEALADQAEAERPPSRPPA
jgi:uncharacterized membrane protein (DUF373 family)